MVCSKGNTERNIYTKYTFLDYEVNIDISMNKISNESQCIIHSEKTLEILKKVTSGLNIIS